MNTQEIKKEIEAIEEEIRMIIKTEGPAKIARKIDGRIQGCSAFACGREKWSSDKILKIGEKLGL